MIKKPMRKYKHKKQIKPKRLHHTFRDKKGHILAKVAIRFNAYTSTKKIPYYYCQTCDLFFRERQEIVVLIQ